MKFTKLALLTLPFAFWACDGSSSATGSLGTSSTMGGYYGELIHERSATLDDFLNKECKVYATDSKVVFVSTASAEGMDPYISFSEIDISGKMKLRDEFHTTEPIFEEVIQGQCAVIKQSYSSLDNPHVSCSDTAIIATAESNVKRTLDEIKTYVNSACDNYIKQVESGSYEKAQSCTVDYAGNIAYLSALYASKAATVKATYLEGGMVLWEETYVGVDSDLFLQACESHRGKEGISNVSCEGNTLTYTETGIDVTFEKFISALNFSCFVVRHGLIPLENMMFEE
ncbi:hypothetical protein [Fibrobacter sp.]|uniref:hypothetical protein n=1 Tax=Fibrobacter sp. TaxID=35828 RepID=UPI002635DA76|nr:hypothetical protein [Fibrobacter sp.]MDD5941258.1 hypothetical protein [Fibrobacter sp.]